MRIGDLIKKKRKEAGLTQDELAKRLDVTKSTLSKWESGRIHNMRRDNIVSLSNALRISPIDLLNAAVQKMKRRQLSILTACLYLAQWSTESSTPRMI